MNTTPTVSTPGTPAIVPPIAPQPNSGAQAPVVGAKAGPAQASGALSRSLLRKPERAKSLPARVRLNTLKN